mgnify:CR=1 FL=1
MLGSEKLASLRIVLFGVTGAVCTAYALMAVVQGRPDPFLPWIPGFFGILSAALIVIAARAAGRAQAAQAMDEGYMVDNHRAQRFGYWVAVSLYPLFALIVWQGLIDWPTAFAAMGTLTGAAYLLGFVWFDLQGRI